MIEYDDEYDEQLSENQARDKKYCQMILSHTKIMSDIVGGISLSKAKRQYGVDLDQLAQQADLELAKTETIDSVIEMIQYLSENSYTENTVERINNLLDNQGTL